MGADRLEGTNAVGSHKLHPWARAVTGGPGRGGQVRQVLRPILAELDQTGPQPSFPGAQWPRTQSQSSLEWHCQGGAFSLRGKLGRRFPKGEHREMWAGALWGTWHRRGHS